jgi:hypothetical protein
MPGLAQTSNDHSRFARLRSSAMAKKATTQAAAQPTGDQTIGQRLIAALIPRYFKSLSALHLAAQGPAYSTLNNWKNGTSVPDWPSIEMMAKLVGRDPLELLKLTSGEVTALKFHPGYLRALERARVRFPNRLPLAAYERAGETHAAQWPEEIDEVFLFDLAQFWWKNASDNDVMKIEEDDVRAEMAAIDKARGR